MMELEKLISIAMSGKNKRKEINHVEEALKLVMWNYELTSVDRPTVRSFAASVEAKKNLFFSVFRRK